MNPVNEQVSQTDLQNVTNKPRVKDLFILLFFLLVPLLFAFVFSSFGVAFSWKGFGIGVLGWVIALFLRGPVGAIAVKTTSKEKARFLVVSSSGPLEELVRLGILLLTAVSYSWASSVGQGWAAVEVVFTIINGVVLFSLMNREDEKAKQAIEILKSQGKLGQNPAWGLVERVFASAYHIGATLMIAAIPWLVLVLIPFHSFFNLYTEKILENKSIVYAEGFVALCGSLILVIGIVLQVIR
jgi:hypothetical protein